MKTLKSLVFLTAIVVIVISFLGCEKENPEDEDLITGSYPNFTINCPGDPFFDGSYIWIPRMKNNDVLKLSLNGDLLTTYKVGDSPYHVSSDGINIWTANEGTVSKICPNGNVSTYVLGNREYYSLHAIEYDGINMWVTGSGGKITKFSKNGAILWTKFIGDGLLGMKFDGTNMWVTDRGPDKVYKLSLDGTILKTIDVATDPWAIDCDSDNNVWITHVIGGKITKLSQEGVVLAVYKIPDGFPTDIVFNGNMLTHTDDQLIELSLDGTILATYDLKGDYPFHGIAFDGMKAWITTPAYNQGLLEIKYLKKATGQ